MSEPTTAVALSDRKAITVTVADRYGMEADTFEAALRNTVFLEGSKAEYAAFLVVCNEYKLNPLTKEIYAFKNKSGKIVPVVSIDGWVTLCNTHPQFDGMTFEDHVDSEGKLYAITCTIYRKDRSHPIEIPEYLSECIRNTEPWKMQHRMLRHKALIQCARYAFGFSGIYDQDEAERVEVTVLPENEDGGSLIAAPGFNGRKPAAPAEVVVEAEFEDRPTTQAADTETEAAQTAEETQVMSASAEPAQEVSQDQTGSSAETASELTTAGSTAPRDTVYRLTGTGLTDDGKIPTFKNGEPFSSVKPEAKVMPEVYDNHPEPEAEFVEAEPEAEAGDAVDALAACIATIRAAPSSLSGAQVLRDFLKTEAGGISTKEVQAGLRLALWTRYAELFEEKVETIQPYEDFALMRGFLEFGARDIAHVDEVWTRFWRHAAYKEATEANKKAINDLLVRTKDRLKPPAA